MAFSTFLLQHFSITAAFVIFSASYAVFAFGKLPGTKIDRTAMAVIGAVLMFVFRILTPAVAVRSIDFPTLILLFTMMLIVAGLHLVGFFDWVVGWIVRHVSAEHLLPGVIFSSGILSAFLVNDIVCLFMAPLVLRLARQMGRDPVPLLLGLATAANIGSTATITGNPQNILIGSLSRIGYVHFLLHLGPVALAGLFIDWGLLHLITRRKTGERSRSSVIRPVTENSAPTWASAPKKLGWPLAVAGLVLAGFFAGITPPLAAAAGAALMLIGKNIDRQKIFEEVDWSLLVLFTGLFLILGGAEEAGIADHLLAVAEHLNLRSPSVFTAVIAVLSNIVSNVPAVMLVKSLIPTLGDAQSRWLLLAMTSTLAGNLTITGSVANIIVVEKARGEADITFWDYLRVGLPVTAVTLTVGVLWLTLVRY